ncbi:MAG: type IV pilin-like G/H family protein [Candidatus Omnitrophota bacterium]
MKKAFTLIELIIVIIIVGILGSLGITQYNRVIEKSRAAEARMVLGTIRAAQAAYKLENGVYATALINLGVSAPEDCNQTTHYYYYLVNPAGSGINRALRCVGTTGKQPGWQRSYLIQLTPQGQWGCSPDHAWVCH